MKKYLSTSIVTLSTAIFLAGCGASSQAVIPNPLVCKNIKHPVETCNAGIQDGVVIHGIGKGSTWGFRHNEYNIGTFAALQVAAEATLLKKHNYFSIIGPATLSNHAGSSVNTAEEFVKQCKVGMLDTMADINSDPCDIHKKGRVSAQLVIKTYENQPLDVLTYDARAVLEYLRKEELFDEKASVHEILPQ